MNLGLVAFRATKLQLAKRGKQFGLGDTLILYKTFANSLKMTKQIRIATRLCYNYAAI